MHPSARPALLRSLLVLLSLSVLVFTAAPGRADPATLAANKALVQRFMDEVFRDRNLTNLDQMVAPGYIQHNPFVPTGRDGLRGMLEEAFKQPPSGRTMEIKRMVAEGDLVVVHSHVRRNAEDRGAAIVDIFRIEDGKLAEHWDVFQPVPEAEKFAHRNGMF